MKISATSITVSDIRIYAFHGVLEQERRVGNDYLVTVTVRFDGRAAVDNDSLEDTVNYAAIVDTVRREMAQPSQLLEHAAGRMAKALFSQFAMITDLDIAITKIHPPFSTPVSGATFTLTATRQ